MDGLGNHYFFGEFVDQNFETAKDYYKKASEFDYGPAITSLGLMYEQGNFFDANIAEANRLYFQAHDLGDDRATYFLAVNIQFGAGIEQNIKRSIVFYEEAIRRGNESAVIDLAFLYVDEEFGTQDFKKSYNLFKSLADKGVADAQYNIGKMHEFGYFVDQSYQKAFEFYLLAHEQEFTTATYAIGELYYNGLLGNDPNYELAGVYYQQAADLEYPPAIYSLAWMWHYGAGRKHDRDKALLLYSQAASLGDPPALNALGLIYSDPSNEVFDITQSREFYKRAYEQGDYFAPLNLARSYNYYVNYGKTSKEMNLYPENIEADILEARHWYSKALEIENYEGIYEYAETFDNEGDFESAKNILLQGLEIADANDPPDIVMKTHLLSFLSGYYHVQGYGEEALRVMKLAVDAVDREDVFEPVQAAMTYRDYGATLNNSGFKDEALIYYKKSEALLREAEEFELLAPTLNGKAVVLEDLELYEEAVKNYHLAFKAIEGFEGDIDLTLGMIHSNIVNALVQLEQIWQEFMKN